MACYGAVVSLEDTMERLLVSLKLNREMTKVVTAAQEKVRSVRNLLRKLDAGSSGPVHNDISDFSDEWTKLRIKYSSLSEVLKRGQSSQSSSSRSRGQQRMNGLDGRMREVARELEDALETHLLNHHQLDHLQQVKLKHDIDSFSRKVMELKEEYAKAEAEEEAKEEEDRRIDDDLASGEKKMKKKMVGYMDVLTQMKNDLIFNYDSVVRTAVLVGMAGIGKTTLARRFFDDPQVSKKYDYRVWVNVGLEYQFIDILKSMLNQLNPTGTNTLTQVYELVWQLEATMKDKRCLIVLDDVWNKEIIPPLRELLVKTIHHTYYHISTLLVTSRLEKIGAWGAAYPWDTKMIKLPFMNKDDSWDLLRDRVFGEDLSQTTCTPELVKYGKKIAENCEGLPLTIVTIADILSKADDMTPAYWNQVAEGQNSVFIDAYKQMSKVLLRSYEFLPRYLKECFLYMAVFPPKYDVPLSKLALLWDVEGCFLSIRDSKKFKNLQGYVSRHVEELIEGSLVLVRKTTFKNKPKTYGLHSAIWHSCVGEAVKNKFFHVFSKYADVFEAERMRNQRRLCVHNNVLFGIKDVQIR